MTKLILDLDTGIDDTLALLYALASPEAQVIGITGTFGNVTMEQGVANDLALLALFGRPDIPVFAGIDHPSWASSFAVMPESGRFHGRNGTGNRRDSRAFRDNRVQPRCSDAHGGGFHRR